MTDATDPTLLVCIDADTGQAMLPLCEFGVLVAELEQLRAERDLLRDKLALIAALASAPLRLR